eukprot:TRINITY_DN19234_c0_g1_i1.p3 TRINITY_DN19234_c0_g1~~TRINITY_DN19234_c0_g1_i1.p3  ORF type:complete len:150 (+),score=45.04 TRINITY_DN19234_c0_g1_i1:57-452(+)
MSAGAAAAASPGWCSNCGGPVMKAPKLSLGHLLHPERRTGIRHMGGYRSESALLNHMQDDVDLRAPKTGLPHLTKGGAFPGFHRRDVGSGALPGVLASPSASHVSRSEIHQAIRRKPHVFSNPGAVYSVPL